MIVLLIGVAIGRMTMNGGAMDEVYLRNSEPTPTPTATKATAKVLAGQTRRHRPPLNHVASTEPPLQDRTAKAIRPSKRPSNLIDGSDGNEPQWSTLGSEGGEDPTALASLESEVVRLVNLQRRKAGCASLRVDPRLTRSARAHSDEMAASNHFEHSSPNGASPWDRMEAAGYRDGGAENIARGYQTAEEAVRGWMRSEGHSRNILNCRLVATGVGVSMGPGGPWWTQDFGYT
jgi:uncharacterized protein YkwD